MQPPSYGRVAVIGMNEFDPSPACQALRGVAEIRDSPLIQVGQLALRRTAPHQCRDRFNEQTKLALARLQCLLGTLPLGQVDDERHAFVRRSVEDRATDEYRHAGT